MRENGVGDSHRCVVVTGFINLYHQWIQQIIWNGKLMTLRYQLNFGGPWRNFETNIRGIFM